MYERILVPLDGSDLAEQVLPYVRLMARALGSTVELLRVTVPVPAEMDQAAQDRYRERALDYLKGVQGSLERSGLTVTVTALDGRPADRIVSLAEERPGALIAMSTHGRSGISRWVVGSVTDKVLHTSHSPLLIVRALDGRDAVRDAQLRTMIVPLDGSSEATEILSLLVPVIKALNLKTTLVRAVRPTVSAGQPDVMDLPDPQAGEREEAYAAEYLQEVSAWFKEQGVDPVECRVLRDLPAGAIVGLARNVPESMVAMSTHGRSGVARSVLGSVTDRVVQQSGDPVLVIRAS